MRSNKVETAVQLFRMSRAGFAGFSGHGNSIYNMIPILDKKCARKDFISFSINVLRTDILMEFKSI